MALRFSKHAENRLAYRLASVISQDEVVRAVTSIDHYGVGETAVIIKRLPKVAKLYDPTDGSTSVGDIVVAVFKRFDQSDCGTVVTVELRGSWQPNPARWSMVVTLI